jgi:type I restriction enzyme S subunit
MFVKSGYKVYEQYCPINDDCSFERYYITDEKFKELNSFSVKQGDFLISCSGVTLGRITQVPDKFKEGVINQALLRLRINKDFVNEKFFIYYFRSPFFQKQIFDNSTGSAIPNIKGVNELKVIPVPLLTKAEQTQIILEIESRLSVCDKVEQTINESILKAEVLRQSILKKAFEGKLLSKLEIELCKKDADYEPASELLKKIKAEKLAKEEALKKTQGKKKIITKNISKK